MIKYIIFKDGNNIFYGQDFSYYRGVPSGVRFEVDEGTFPSKSGLFLRAPGYGGTPYGNGALFVPFKQEKGGA